MKIIINFYYDSSRFSFHFARMIIFCRMIIFVFIMRTFSFYMRVIAILLVSALFCLFSMSSTHTHMHTLSLTASFCFRFFFHVFVLCFYSLAFAEEMKSILVNVFVALPRPVQIHFNLREEFGSGFGTQTICNS